MAGLSLGEYTALVHAGAMSFEDALRVVKVRAESMQAAGEAQQVSRLPALYVLPLRASIRNQSLLG